MAADDPVDTKAMIFTEADVYMVGGWLSEVWSDRGVPEDDEGRTDDIELAITEVLAASLT